MPKIQKDKEIKALQDFDSLLIGENTYIDPSPEGDSLTEETKELKILYNNIIKAMGETDSTFHSIIDRRVSQGSVTTQAAKDLKKVYAIQTMEDSIPEVTARPAPRDEVLYGMEIPPFKDSKQNKLQTLLSRISSGEIDATNIEEDMGRVKKAEGGSILADDRESYAEGKDVEKTITLDTVLFEDDKEKRVSIRDALEKSRPDSVYAYMQSGNKDWLFSTSYGDEGGEEYQSGQMPKNVGKKRLAILQSLFDSKDVLSEALPIGTRTKKAEGGSLLTDDREQYAQSEEPTHTMPDGTEMAGATYGEYEEQMEGLMDKETPMLPDEEMEEDYVNYVIEETLPSEDRNYLISALEKDDRLSEIFDQVVESATEFSGEGPVDGPGTEKSDSIPARLSDGEFVFTAKAVEEIGVDTLTSMMKDAEAEAEQRQSAAEGGMIDEEDNAAPVQTTGLLEAQGNIPNVVKQSQKIDEEMLKSSPRGYYVPTSG